MAGQIAAVDIALGIAEPLGSIASGNGIGLGKTGSCSGKGSIHGSGPGLLDLMKCSDGKLLAGLGAVDRSCSEVGVKVGLALFLTVRCSSYRINLPFCSTVHQRSC